MTLDLLDLAILRYLPENGGFTTNTITHRFHGPLDLRKHSAIMYRRLYSLSQGGYIREMDNEKPIVWTLTAAGKEKSHVGPQGAPDER